MKVEVVNYALNNCHLYGPAILHRVLKFNRDNDLDARPETLYHTVAHEMMLENPEVLILAALEGKKVVGHMMGRIVNMDGTLVMLVTQLEIDKKYREGREKTIADGLDIIKKFARGHGAEIVRCWAMNEKVGTIFERLGFKSKPHILMDVKLEAEDGDENSSDLDE